MNVYMPSASDVTNAYRQLMVVRRWTLSVGLIVTVNVPMTLHNFTFVFTRWTGSSSDIYAVR